MNRHFAPSSHKGLNLNIMIHALLPLFTGGEFTHQGSTLSETLWPAGAAAVQRGKALGMVAGLWSLV